MRGKSRTPSRGEGRGVGIGGKGKDWKYKDQRRYWERSKIGCCGGPGGGSGGAGIGSGKWERGNQN